MDLSVKLLRHPFGNVYSKRGERKRNHPRVRTDKISYFCQQMTRTDQATILTQHLASDIFISDSLQIIELAFKTFVISSSPPKNLIGRDSMH